MRKLTFIYIFLFFTGSIACTNERTPDKVATKFLKAVSQGHYDRAKKFSTERTASMLDVVQSLSTIAPEKNKAEDYEIMDYEISGEFATVKYKIKGSAITDQLRLVRQGEEWKVGSVPDMGNTEVSSI